MLILLLLTVFVLDRHQLSILHSDDLVLLLGVWWIDLHLLWLAWDLRQIFFQKIQHLVEIELEFLLLHCLLNQEVLERLLLLIWLMVAA